MQIATLVPALGLCLQDKTFEDGDSSSHILLASFRSRLILPYGLTECKGFWREVAVFSAPRAEEQRKHLLQTT